MRHCRRHWAIAWFPAVLVISITDWQGSTVASERPPHGPSLIAADGGFEGRFVENGTDAFCGTWGRFPIDGITKSRMTASRREVHSGKAAQAITVTRLLNGNPRLSIPIPGGIAAGQSYEAAFWIKSRNRDARAVVCVHDVTHWFPKTHALLDVEVGQVWRQAALRFRAEKDDPKACMGIYLSEENTLWVDDAEFRLLDGDGGEPLPRRQKMRRWSDATGKNEVSGRLVAVSEDTIRIAKENGWFATVPRDRLAPADRDFVAAVDVAVLGEEWLVPPPRGGNLLRYGSFETGLAGWHTAGAKFTSEPMPAAAHGLRVAVVDHNGIAGSRLESLGMRLAWGRPHVLSFSVRGLANAPVTAAIMSGTATLQSQSFAAPADRWERCSLAFTPPPVPDGVYYVSIVPPSSGRIMLDAVQVEESGTASAFATALPVEAKLILDGERRPLFFRPDDKVTGTLSLFNATDQPQRISMRRRICDVWEREIPDSVKTWELTVPPGHKALKLTFLDHATQTGAFRVECAAEETDGQGGEPYAEALFSVLPPSSKKVQAPLGVTLDYNIGGEVGYRAAGYGWNKTWWLDWVRAQPTAESPFAFSPQQDQRVAAWQAAGLKTLGILQHAPPWAQSFQPGWGWSNPADFTKQTAYAAEAVRHYGDRVAVWELQNEPNQEVQAAKGESRAVAYAKEAAALATGSWRANPNVKLLLGSLTVRDEFGPFFDEILSSQPVLKEVDPQTGRPRLYGVSFHFYTADPALIRRSVADIRAALAKHRLEGLKIWDTEWSPIDNCQSLKRAELRGPTRYAPSPRRGAALVVQGFIARLGEGVEASLLYDTYNPGDMGQAGHKVMLELDGSFRPVAAAVATLSQMLRGATSCEPFTIQDAWGYRVNRSGMPPVSVLWTHDRLPTGRTVEFTTPEAATVTDMMGNVIDEVEAGGVVTVGADPIYVAAKAAKFDPSGKTTEDTATSR